MSCKLSTAKHPAVRLTVLCTIVVVFGALPCFGGVIFPAREFPMGGGAGSPTAGDFNRDGKADLIVVHREGISVLLGRGDGTLSPPVGYRVNGASGLSIIKAGDFDRDDIQDLLVNDTYYDLIYLFHGLGDGSFAGPFQVAGAHGSLLAVGDFAEDGALDFATRTQTGIAISINNGIGGFLAPRAMTSIGFIGYLESGDFNGDHHTDLIGLESITFGGQNAYRVEVFPGNGDGSFGQTTTWIFPSFARDLAIADLDGDGSDDVLIADDGSSYVVGPGGVSIYFMGNGTPVSGAGFRAGLGTNGITVADFNSDGMKDFALQNSGSGDTTVFMGDGARGFLPRGTYGVGGFLSGLVPADVNGDGRDDLIFTVGSQDGAIVLLGKGDGSFATYANYASTGVPELVADLNGDAQDDLLAIDQYGGHLSMLPGIADGSFGIEESLPFSIAGTAVGVADFTGDRRNDIAEVDYFDNSKGYLLIHPGVPGGGFGPALYMPVGPYPQPESLRHADLNGDGQQDILLISGLNHWDLEILLANGDGSFIPRNRILLQDFPYSIAFGDFNRDGILDLVLAHQTLAPLELYFGRGDGDFEPPVPLNTQVGATAVCVGDINSDGIDDLAYGTEHSATIQLGIGDGRFLAPLPADTRSGPPSWIGDFNQDGNLDVVSGNSILLGHGDGTFESAMEFSLYRVIGVRDFNGDGRLDLAVRPRSPGFGIFLNVGPFPDTDHDGTFDTQDLCTDTDGDGLGNPGFPVNQCPQDNCPSVPNGGQSDADGDGVGDACDNCLQATNSGQEDSDHDGLGDECDPCTDSDRDGLGNPGLAATSCALDNCPNRYNPSQEDSDADGAGDACDTCVSIPNPTQSDGDKDGIGDACDSCTDADHDGFGNPGYPLNTCSRDICPLVFDPLQKDYDGDSVGDSCDLCTDSDGDGFGDPSFPLNVCAEDDCPNVYDPNPGDSDEDGLGDACDFCPHDPVNDQDDDLVCGDVDNCPRLLNPDQADLDHDGVGDACDNCIDSDRDGFSDPGLQIHGCRVDNCPNQFNPFQEDEDRDDIGDVCDPCLSDQLNDSDGDGVCASLDNCIAMANPNQSNSDGDQLGDVCDSCPMDQFNDADGDGLCANADNCSLLANPGQADIDGDGAGDACDRCLTVPDPTQTDRDDDGFGDACDICPLAADPEQSDTDADGKGDACDNCLDVANPEQADGNEDSSGDACQPTVTITSLRSAGQGVLLASATARDPLGDPLRGDLDFIGTVLQNVDLQDALYGVDCSLGFLPDGVTGEGIAFAFGSAGVPLLIDLDVSLSCGDGMADFEIALGSCANPEGSFSDIAFLTDLTPPATVCVRRVNNDASEFELSISRYDEAELHGIATFQDASALKIPFETRLPRRSGLSSLTPGNGYRLVITVTDGSTVPAHAEASFVYQGEQVLIIDNPPVAVARSAESVECDRPAGAVVLLDGSGSTDPESTPGTHDEIVSFEWFSNYSLPGQTLLGTGEMLETVLPLGSNTVVLQVTDSDGISSTAETRVSVADTTSPQITLAPTPSTLWPPNHRMVDVAAPAIATDACSTPTIVLDSVTSSELDDAPSSSDGNTSGDIQGATPGTSDFSFQLRAERDGVGGGRFYRVTYSAIDSTGNRSASSALILVPHDQGGVTEPIILAARGEPKSSTFSWNIVPDADSYQMIRGEVGGLREAGSFIDLGSVSCIYPSDNVFTERTDSQVPPPGRAYFYLVSYSDGMDSGFGTDAVSKPRIRTSGGCDGSGIPSDPNSIAGGAGASTTGDRLKSTNSP